MLAVMLLSEKEKEALVIEMLNKGLTSMEIAKRAHVSFTYIKRIRAKITGEVNEDNKPLSLSSQAFKLFLGGKSLVGVAISLDIQREQVIKIYKDYLTLQKTSKFVSILDKHGDTIPVFLAWLDCIEKNNVKPGDIAQAIECIKNMQSMQQQRKDLENEIGSLESEGFHRGKHCRYQRLSRKAQ
jgi:hypothetical protein